MYGLSRKVEVIMGFWSSFLGAGAAQIYNDVKKDQKETQEWNDLFHEKLAYESSFNEYLQSVGIMDSYIGDVEYVNNGNILPIKREIDNLRKKINEYISLGGQGKNLLRLNDIDDELETVKYLKKMGCLHRHEEFAGLGLLLTKDQLERELREDRGIQIILKAPGNELVNPISQRDSDFVPYNSDSEAVINIDVAQVYDEDIVEFLQFLTVSLKFTQENMYVYSYNEHDQMYYATTIGKETEVIISSIPIPAVKGWGLANINGLQVIFPLENIEKVKEFYFDHNMLIIQQKEDIQHTAAENINQLSGIEFEKVCQKLVEKMGFDTEITKASGDGGIDLIAYNHQPLLSGKYIIQCKRYSGSVGEPIIRDLYGVVTSERANKGILMTTGYFTKSAISFAEGKPIELIDGEKMQYLLCEYGLSASKCYDYYCDSDDANKDFFKKTWKEYKDTYSLFDNCLEELGEVSTYWQENWDRHDSVVFAFKVYETFMMASSVKSDMQFVMFCNILDAENVGGIVDRRAYFHQLVTNEGGLRDSLREAAISYGKSSVGIFWNMIATVSNEMGEYSYFTDLLKYHADYVTKLGIALQYFMEKDIRIDTFRKITVDYYEEAHKLLKAYIASKKKGLL